MKKASFILTLFIILLLPTASFPERLYASPEKTGGCREKLVMAGNILEEQPENAKMMLREALWQESLNEMLERIRKESEALQRLIEAIGNQYVLKIKSTKKSKSKQ